MTSAPVVTASVTTRTVRESWRLELVPEDVWVVLDEHPGDLEVPCPHCHGRGSVDLGLDWARCPVCNGTGRIVRVYVAEEQWRYIASTSPTEWADGTGADTPSVQTRQVIRWVATEAEVSPFMYGQTMLHLSGFQPVDPPITEMVCDCDAMHYGPCSLSVPSGTVTRIELP